MKYIKIYEKFKERTVEDFLKENNIKNDVTELDCSSNRLTSLKGIENLNNLTKLYCHSNQLTSLKGIENLNNLTKLSCSSNQLTSLKGIENLNNLTYLSCDSNQITSLKGIENLNNLTKLWCYLNPIKYPFWKENCKIKYDDNQIKYFKSYECQKSFLDKFPERVQELKEFGYNTEILNDPEYQWIFDQESNGFFGLKN